MSEMDDTLYSALKFHFFPRLLTPWDLKHVIDASPFSIEEVMKGEFKELDMGEGEQRLLNSALLKLQSIYKQEKDTKVLTKQRLENWIMSQRQGIKALIEIEQQNWAQRLILNLATFIGFLITKYVSSESLPDEFEEIFGDIKFSEECFSPLAAFLTDETWKMTLEEVNFQAEFYLMVSSYLQNISLHHKSEGKKFQESINWILALKEKVGEYLQTTTEKPRSYYTTKVLERSLIMGAWEQEGEGLLEDLAAELYKTEEPSRINDILGDLFNAIAGVLEGKQEELFKGFRSIGERLMKERLRTTGMTEKLAFALPPAMLAAITSNPTPAIDIFGELNPQEIPFLSSQTSKTLANWSNEVKFLLFSLLGQHPDVGKVIGTMVKDPRASSAVLSLIGPLFPFMVDLIMICSKREYEKDKVNKLIGIFTQVFREKLSVLRTLRKEGGDSDFSRILDFFASREIFWTDFRFFSKDVKEKIKSYRAGSALLDVYKDLRSFLEVSLTTSRQREQRIPEKIKDLYI